MIIVGVCLVISVALFLYAHNKFDVPIATVSLTAATARSVLGVKAATNVCIKLTEAAISFDGANSANAPVICKSNQATFATNPPGTNSTAQTPAKRDTGRAETIQATAANSWVAANEPTVLTLQRAILIGQFNGVYHNIFPQDTPFIIIGGQGFDLQLNSPNNVNFGGHLTGEE